METFDKFYDKYSAIAVSWLSGLKSTDRRKKCTAWLAVLGVAFCGVFSSFLWFTKEVIPLWELSPQNTKVYDAVPPRSDYSATPADSLSGTDSGPSGKLSSEWCTTVLRASRDYRFDDGPQQLEALSLFEKALPYLSRE